MNIELQAYQDCYQRVVSKQEQEEHVKTLQLSQ